VSTLKLGATTGQPTEGRLRYPIERLITPSHRRQKLAEKRPPARCFDTSMADTAKECEKMAK
jgi:hypothetical protein